MHVSWKDFLLHHSSCSDLEANSREIQNVFNDPNTTAADKFSILADHKALVVISCNPIGKELQASFFHHQLKESFATKKKQTQLASWAFVNMQMLFGMTLQLFSRLQRKLYPSPFNESIPPIDKSKGFQISHSRLFK